MKKRMLAFFVLLLFALANANLSVAEDVFAVEYRVAFCNEYITLREEPSTKASEIERIPLGAIVTALSVSENGFYYVNYNGKSGYALSKYLECLPSFVGERIALNEAQRKNMNLFLSNFTESYLSYHTGGVFDLMNAPDEALVEFAVEHMWFNYHESRIEWGEYNGGNNVRVHKKYVPEITEKYFGVTPSSPSPLYVDYLDPYYYWTETGGHTAGGFASVSDITYLGANRYHVTFSIFADGNFWEISDTKLTLSEAREKFPDYERRGSAIVYAPNLDDRASYKLTRIVIG